ncbi:hypothetical protein HPO96_35030 [Kribbella sandramycini]|uniref:Uncharacterized protein n=1 Tax=Kribbella sandramycini TaxID=60450 RepID=A0A7Y4L6U1_9ACTN|nr:hypothetical protein [Kribbella sandramycini]MBB6566687.1 hypothetical protein [Kribbella sandramycini]NOL45475.1 hypothetical protein [Kribbella sandramycini]
MSGEDDPVRRRIAQLVARAEAIVERQEAGASDGRWAMTAFSRYRLCTLVGVLPYTQDTTEDDGDALGLLEEAAQAVDDLEVPLEDLTWRLALGDAIRATAASIRVVRDADDV